MAVVMITGEMLYRMNRLKAELAERKRRSRWVYLAALALVVAWLLIGK